jgi:septal ring factor EnvC (AmiA/AmiB activator)
MRWLPWRRLDRIEDLLQQVLQEQRTTAQEIRKMAATQQDIDNALTAVETDLTTLQTDTAAVLAKLQSVQPGTPAPDFTPEVARLTALHAALAALSTSEESATTPAPTPTPAA